MSGVQCYKCQDDGKPAPGCPDCGRILLDPSRPSRSPPMTDIRKELEQWRDEMVAKLNKVLEGEQ